MARPLVVTPPYARIEGMNTRLEKAVDAIRKLPERRQEELADVLESAIEDHAEAFAPEQLQQLKEGIADADAGRFATDKEVEDLFARFGRI